MRKFIIQYFKFYIENLEQKYFDFMYLIAMEKIKVNYSI